MHTRRPLILCFATIGLLILTAGCGVAPTVPAAPSDIDWKNVVFTEDAEPAIAALEFVPDELLVQPFPGASPTELSDLYTASGAVVVGRIAELDLAVLRVSPDALVTAAKQLGGSGLIETVQKNYLYQPSEIPNDPLYERQTHLARIRATSAWEVTLGGPQIVIAIVDTGVDPDHPDIESKILGGWNVYDNDDNFADVQGHGTTVAGVAAAVTNNGEGVAGVAWDTPLLAVRVGDADGAASAREIAAGILWAVSSGARVINVSFAPLWSNRVVQAAAKQAMNHGCLVVISAGNEGGATTSPGYEEALFVGAVSASDQIASFSDRGRFVDLVAPGTGIRSTELGGDYRMANGTSFSAPIVSGVAALAWSINPELRPATIMSAILDTAVDLGASGDDDTYGRGLIDAAAVVEAVSTAVAVPDTAPPTVGIERPAAGATLVDRYSISVSAADDWGLADVVMLVDSVPFATDTRDPYRFMINAATFPEGPHVLSFVATDLAGNSSEPAAVSVTFARSSRSSNGSSTSIGFHSPQDGAIVSGYVSIQATIADEDGLATVEWRVDGQSVLVMPASGTTSGVSYRWASDAFAPGSHTVTLTVTDATGRQSTGQLELVTR